MAEGLRASNGLISASIEAKMESWHNQYYCYDHCTISIAHADSWKEFLIFHQRLLIDFLIDFCFIGSLRGKLHNLSAPIKDNFDEILHFASLESTKFALLNYQILDTYTIFSWTLVL